MKKLFSIFCCLLLSASMVTQAQELLAPKKQAHPLVLKSANAPTKAPTATNRHNAPQADEYDVVYNYEWSEYAGLFCNQSGTNYRYAGFRWTAGADFMFDLMTVFAKATEQGFLTTTNKQLYFPKNGTYSVLNGTYSNTSYVPGGNSGVCTQAYANGQCKTSYTSSFSIWGELLEASAEWYDFIISGGSVSIQYGANQRPYLEADVTSSSYGGWAFFLTVGRLFGFDLQATNGSIDMVDNDDNAHYYSNDQHYGFSAGTSATLTAIPNSGYEFDHWEYNGQNYGNTNPLNWSVASGDDTYNGNTDGYIHLTAVFRAAASGVDVTLNSNGGSNNNQVVSATNGSAMPTTLKAGGAIAKPSRSGYTFGGYYANNDGTGKQYYTATLTSANNWDKTVATTIYAKWTQTVTLNANTANHGSGSNRSATATVNGTALSSFTATTAASGYTLEGYYTDATSGTKVLNANGTYAANNVTNYITSGKWTKTGATTLYAHMTAHTYNVVFNGNGSTGGSMSNQSHTYGSSKALTANAFTRTGYTFRGWATSQANADAGTVTYSDGQSVTNLTTTNNGTYNLYAVWQVNTYTVTIAAYPKNAGYGTLQKNDETPAAVLTFTDVPHNTAKPANAGTGNQAITFFGNTVTPIPTEAANGYTYAFSGWGNASSKITSDREIKANFTRTAIEYTITYNNYDISTYPGTLTTIYTVETPTITLPFAPNVAKEGYTFGGWYDNEELTGTPVTSIAQGSTGNKEFWAKWEAKTYAITYNAGANGTGTIAAGEKTYNVNFTLSSSTFTREGYTQTGWSTEDGGSKAYDLGGTYTANTAVTLYPYWEINTYDITFKNADGTTLKKSDGTTDAVYSVAYGETPVYDGATPTKAADSEYTYTFNGWDNEIVAATEDATYTATYSTTKVQYTLTWDVNGGNELTGTYTNGKMDWGTAITAPADPTKSGYTFGGWDANNDGKADEVAETMPTTSLIYKAIWVITLCEDCKNDHYNTFKTNHDGETVNVTYNRQFASGRWSTMCLPFNLDLAALITHKMYGRVYEFKYATGNANVGSGVNLYFSNATSIEAGKCYIVNADATLAAKTSFVFSRVTIDLSKDIVEALESEDDYDDLPGDKSQGTIELVGTLRNGTLQGSAKDNTYMGLKNNKIYYPNTTYPGSTIWAYRGIFRSSEILDKESMQKMRIIVDGEDRGELIIDADGDILAPSDAQSRKFIENGVLYIEREGVIYDAQGKRIK